MIRQTILLSFVTINGNLKFEKNALYLSHFPATRKSEIRISKLETSSNEPNPNFQNEKKPVRARLCSNFEHSNFDSVSDFGFRYSDINHDLLVSETEHIAKIVGGTFETTH